MFFKDKLYNIMKDLKKMGNHNDTMYRCVSQRLDFSLNNYDKEITKTCNYLISRSSYKVMKEITRQGKGK